MNKDEYLKHFSLDISHEIDEYAVNEIFKHSRYIFTRRKNKKQYGYCTHCNQEFETDGLRHNESDLCPLCHSHCKIKASGLGRSRLMDDAYFVYYDKSLIDPNAIIARGIYASRDYRNNYKNVKTQFAVKALYLFRPGDSIFMERYGYNSNGEVNYVKQNSVYSLFSHYTGCKRICCSYESIKKAIKDTPFQYSTWESYVDGDMVKFFSLYARYPCVEYFTKLGFESLVRSKLYGYSTFSAINWRGKSLLSVLKISKKELRELKAANIQVSTLLLRLYQQSLQDGSRLSFDEIKDIQHSYGPYFNDLRQILKYTTLRHANSYLHKQFEQQPKVRRILHSLSQVLITWRDYIADCKSLLMNLEDSRILFPKDILKAHQETSKRVKSEANKLMDRLIENRLPSLNFYCFEYEGLLIRPAVSTGELIAEGKALNICVGTYSNGYMTKYSKGQTNLLLIRKMSEPDKPFYTMELCKDSIIQVQGKGHCQPDKAVAEFIKKFTEAKLTKRKSKLAVSA